MVGFIRHLSQRLRRLADKLEYRDVREAKRLGVSVPLYRSVARIQAREPIKAVIDVGANSGAWAQMISRLLPNAAIHCFEPVPSCLAQLADLKQRLPQLSVYPCALGARRESAIMNVNHFSPSSSLLEMSSRHRELWPETDGSTPIPIAVSTLDHELSEFHGPALLKLDVQGYELPVLQGGYRILRSCHLVISEVLFEDLYLNQTRVGALIEFMHDQGFRIGEVLGQHRTDSSQFLAYADLVFVPRRKPEALETGLR